MVEAVTPADLGKFTDSGLADALQRVPGVQVDRNARGQNAGSAVSIRGLGADFVNTTWNGRNMLGTPDFNGGGTGRNLDYDSITPEVITGLLVYKTPTANLLESGLAGEIDLQTLRPLDYKSPSGSIFGSVAVQDNYESRRKKSGPRVSGIMGAKLFDNTLGFYVAGVYSNEYTRQFQTYSYVGPVNVTIDGASAGQSVTYKRVLGIQETDSAVTDFEYQRRGISYGAQWRPTNALEINVDGIYNKFITNLHQTVLQNYTGYTLSGGTTEFTPGGAIVRGDALVDYDTTKVVGGFPGGGSQVADVSAIFQDRNTNDMNGINAKYKWDKFSVAGDYAHGDVTYDQPLSNAYWISDSTLPVNGNYDSSGNTFRATYYGPNTPANPAIYNTSASSANGLGYYYQQFHWKSKRDQERIDAVWDALDWLMVKGGGRLEQTLVTNVLATGPNVFENGTDYYSTTGYFTGGETYTPGGGNVPSLSLNGFCHSNPTVCKQSNFGRGSFSSFPTSAAGSPQDELTLNSGSSFKVREKTTAFYLQSDMKGNIRGYDVAGNIGVRRVKVEDTSNGFQSLTYSFANTGSQPVPDGTLYQGVPVLGTQGVNAQGSNSYTKTLPSGNLLFKPRADLNLRLAYAKSMTLPGYFNLRPNGNVLVHIPNPNEPGVVDKNIFQGGNPELKPTMANNYDATAEFYTSYGGAVILSYFRKDVTEFITTLSQLAVNVPGRSELFDSTTAVNADKGRTSGFEIGTNQPFAFLPSPFDGFGVTGNFTHVSSHQSVTFNGEKISSSLPGTSKTNINGTAYYEKHGFAARVAYNYRSDYVVGVGSIVTNGDVIDREYVRGYHTIDMSLSQKFLDHFEVILTGSNLGGAQQIHYFGNGQLLGSLNQFPKTFTLGLRGKL